MNSTATAVAFRRSGGPRVVSEPRISQAALQAELVRGAMVRNTQSISPIPEPLKPAPLLGLVELAVIGVIAAVGELVKRFSQLWGSNNSRAEKEAIWEKYAYYRAIGIGHSGWESTSSSYPVALAVDSLTPRRTAWPGKIEFYPVPPASGVGGQIVLYGFVSKSVDPASFETNDVGSGSRDVGAAYPNDPYVGRTITYEFSNSNSGNTVLATYSGNSNISTEPQEDPYILDAVPLVPITGLSPLSRPPLIPAAAPVAQTAPLKQVQVPTAAAVPVVPKVTASPALVAAWKIISSEFYRPDRLPTLPRPATTATRSTTSAGTLVAPAALPVPQTATDLRKYGSQVITAIGVRPDLASIAAEVGRIEQKTGRMLQDMDKTPDWFDRLLGPLLNELKDQILDALVVDVPATVYGFEAPCDKDGEGEPVVHEAEIEAADYQPAIVARLDAIAEAMGVLKGWKSRTCRTSSPRSNVTVTAFEFNPES